MLLNRIFDVWKTRPFSNSRRSVPATRRRRSLTLARPVAASESLECRALLATTILVTNTNDSGAGSLRQAIEDANQSMDEARIEFAIPNTDPNFVDADNALSVPGADPAADVFVISPLSELPTINNVNDQAVTLDATTQATFSGNTNPNGPEVVLDGNANTNKGLVVESDGVEIRGFVLRGFGDAFGGYAILGNGSDLTITANYIGTDATGTLTVANSSTGIGVFVSTNIQIGGEATGEGNVISGNAGYGIEVSNIQGLEITGNKIGTDVTGLAPLGNDRTGIEIRDSFDVSISNNVVGDNNGHGIALGNSGSDTFPNQISGNHIGVGADGTIDLGNTLIGVVISRGENIHIDDNVISGNDDLGVLLDYGLRHVVITSNRIGTDASGTTAIGNSSGLLVAPGSSDVMIGGSEPGDGNIISGNLVRAVHIWGSQEVQVVGNKIGTGVSGSALPNGERGLDVEGSQNVEIHRNNIAFNVAEGVFVRTAQGTTNHSLSVQITRNSIHSNGALGIDIAGANIGITPNDVDDADGEANLGQNFPVLNSTTLSGNLVTINYSVPSAPTNSAYPLHVEFFAADADPDAPEGQTYLGSDTFTAADFATGFKTITLGAAGSVGARIVATATDADGNTSEFSAGHGIDHLEINLPSIGGPFTVSVIAGNLHVRRANNSEVITPQPVTSVGTLLIRGSNSVDHVTLHGSLNGVVEAVRFLGRAGNDLLDARLATFGVSMEGAAGNDTLWGGSGHDLFVGGTENDSAEGNAGRDSLFGDTGNDHLNGGDGADVLDGSDGNDQLNGGLGDDTLTGGLGNDGLAGGGGLGDLLFETLHGSLTMTASAIAGALGRDGYSGFERGIIVGGYGNDSLNAAGATFPVTLEGGDGNDTLVGGQGNDLILGGSHDDVLTGGFGNDQLLGGNGTDRLTESADVNFTLTDTSLVGVGTDTFRDIEAVQLTGGRSANSLVATLYTKSVTLNGGEGNDILVGGSAADSLDGGGGDDSLTGNGGNDRLTGGNGTGDTVVESGATAYKLSNALLTGVGSDVLKTIERARLTTAATASSIDARTFTGRTTLTGGGGNDTLWGGTSLDSILGGDGNDVLRGGNGKDSILGGSGQDIILGDAGDDSLSGSSSLAANDNSVDGDDTILGGSGKDRMFGGLGNDILSGEADNDTLTGDGGTDSLFGGAGSDSPGTVALPDTLSADGVFNDAAFTTNLAALLAAFP